MGKQNVGLIEVGFPYSDPIADGPVIQASYTRALEHKLKVGQIFETVSQLDTDNLPPLLAMVSYAIVFRTGPEKFVEQAKQAGFAGLIVPDLPGDEAEEFAAVVKPSGLDLVQLMAPTTPQDRAEKILKTGSGFVYCISVSGTTGERTELPAELQEQLKWLRTKTELPLAVGFGISQPGQVDVLRDAADGVIVGSAIVRMLENWSDSGEAVLKQVSDFAGQMVAATDGKS